MFKREMCQMQLWFQGGSACETHICAWNEGSTLSGEDTESEDNGRDIVLHNAQNPL